MEIYLELTKKQHRLLNEEFIDILQGIPYGVRVYNKNTSRAYNLEFDDVILESVCDWLESNSMSFQMDLGDTEDLSEEAKDYLKRNSRS